MGQKPLFYGELPGGGLAFGSEPKAVLAHPGIGRTLDHASLVRYLFYEYVPAPHSIWRSLHKLPRGHALCWEDGTFRVWRYWDPPVSTPAEPRLRNRGRAILDAVPRRGRRATGARMCRSAFFSPEVSIPRASPRPSAKSSRPATSTRSRSASKIPSFDESRHARAVAHHLGTDHHEQTFSIETRLSVAAARSQAGSTSRSAMRRFCRPIS